MSRTARIAITVGCESYHYRPEEDRGRYLPYAAALRRAGAEPVMLGLEHAPAVLADATAFLAGYDGLLLSGGVDVHPALYPNPPALTAGSWDEVIAAQKMEVNRERDALELALARAAFAVGLPVLGICRGHQLLNVALGGRLILDLDPALGHAARPDRVSAHHPVSIAAESSLESILGGKRQLRANSRHHQAVDPECVAPALRVVAWAAETGVVEAVVAPDHRWLVGVQWHPERPEDAESYEASWPLFVDFVAACRNGHHG